MSKNRLELIAIADVPREEHDPGSSVVNVTALSLAGLDELVEVSARYGSYNVLRPDLVKSDLPALASLFRQKLDDEGAAFFGRLRPTSAITGVDRAEKFVFSQTDSGALYNWELFFYAPWLAAKRLQAEGNHEEAMRWYHTLFDPTRPEAALDPQQAWFTAPLVEAGLAGTDWDSWAASLTTSNARPFEPHAIAASRPMAYQRAVFIDYVTNLLDWGDRLFRQDTRESIGEAAQLYWRALGLLGRRPVLLSSRPLKRAQSYRALSAPTTPSDPTLEFTTYGRIQRTQRSVVPLPVPPTLWAFCMPINDQMISLWDRVEDRLFKIRNSLNIDGIRRELALFAPPIDPAILVRARAMGLSIDGVLDAQLATPPVVRFRPLLNAATAVAQRCQGLGAALLSAIERGDGEQIGILRQQQEMALLGEVRDVRLLQISEARKGVASAEQALASAKARVEYYKTLIDEALLDEEDRPLQNDKKRAQLRATVAGLTITRGILSAIGEVTVSADGGITFGPAFAGSAVGAAESGISYALQEINEHNSHGLTIASYTRREQDWKQQLALAQVDVKATTASLDAANLRLKIAEKELENHDLQITNSREMRDVLESKYSNEALYGWMATELRYLYQQTTDFALSIARQAEASFRRETGEVTATFIQPVYSADQQDGLLAGERLLHDLQRMEQAFLTRQRPGFEISRDISLADLDPVALELLRAQGVCYVELEEPLFDLDSAGDYDRRLRTVAFSVPCVRGAFQSVPLRVTLERSSIRRAPARAADIDSERAGLPVQIVLSHGQKDAGRFGDDPERFGPFETYGAISSWRLEVPSTAAGFDAASIQDVIFHVQYCSRSGGDVVRRDVESKLSASLRVPQGSPWAEDGWVVAVRLSGEVPDAWFAWRNEAAEGVVLSLAPDRLPVWLRDRNPKVANVHVLAVGLDAQPMSVHAWRGTDVSAAPGEATPVARGWAGNLYGATLPQTSNATLIGSWCVDADGAPLPSTLSDVIVFFELIP